jgi:hypothetical protein
MSSLTGLRLLLIHFFVTSVLTGLIWTIQIVHYPLFAQVGRNGFVAYERSHSFRISTLVGPLMGLEFICAVLIVWKQPIGTAPLLAWFALVALVLVHLCTVAFSVPAHNVLGGGFDVAAHHRLVQSNWIRTIGWTLRAALAAVMVSGFFEKSMARLT